VAAAAAAVAPGEGSRTRTPVAGGRARHTTAQLATRTLEGLTLDSGTTLQVHEVIENQRKRGDTTSQPGEEEEEEVAACTASDSARGGFSAAALRFNERGEWSDVHGQPSWPKDNDTPPPPGWFWLDVWHVEVPEGHHAWPCGLAAPREEECWEYCNEWRLWPGLWHTDAGAGSDLVRRRRWHRLCQNTAWQAAPVSEPAQRQAIELHLRRRRRHERGVRMLQRMERYVRLLCATNVQPAQSCFALTLVEHLSTTPHALKPQLL
jgi:hypothetical protein